MDDKKEHDYALKHPKIYFLQFFIFYFFTSFAFENLKHNIFLKYQYEFLNGKYSGKVPYGTMGRGK